MVHCYVLINSINTYKVILVLYSEGINVMSFQYSLHICVNLMYIVSFVHKQCIQCNER